MQDQPFFSICIPVFKNVTFLKRLLDSIFEQTWTDYEIVVTDDSPDDTVGKWIKEHYPSPALRYARNETSLGTPENWNEAIRQARGKWIKLMHDDDWFANKYSLQIFQQHILSSGASFVFSNYYNVYLDGDISNKLMTLPEARWKKVQKYPGNLYAFNIIGPPSVTAIKADIAKQELYDPTLQWLVDLDCYIRILKKSKARHISEPLVCIGVGSTQVTAYTQLNPEVEIPEGLTLYSKLGDNAFDHVLYYDAWWRLLRNLGIRDAATLEAYAKGLSIPTPVGKMLVWQRILPQGLLKAGPVSKTIMFFSWLLR